MKTLLFLLVVPFIQVDDNQLESIADAINKRDLPTLSNFMDETVEIAILEDGDIYLKTEAISKLKSFFSKYKNTSFNAIHTGVSDDKGSLYCIGKFNASGESYRVFMYIKVESNSYFIQELRFEKNKS